jgi:hypothetical protein
LNRNPLKRLGAGKRDADDIKEHPFLAMINWQDAINKKLKVPKPYVKKTVAQEIPLDKIFGKGAFDDNLKNHNRLNEWSFVLK